MDLSRIARQARICEIYCRFIDPMPGPNGSLPYTPKDHVLQMRSWLEVGESAETLPIVKMIAAAGEPGRAAEYAALLSEEAPLLKWPRT